MNAALHVVPAAAPCGPLTCQGCRFYVGRGRGPGECHVQPPVVLVMPDSRTGTVVRWPDVLPTEWCGRWEPR